MRLSRSGSAEVLVDPVGSRVLLAAGRRNRTALPVAGRMPAAARPAEQAAAEVRAVDLLGAGHQQERRAGSGLGAAADQTRGILRWLDSASTLAGRNLAGQPDGAPNADFADGRYNSFAVCGPTVVPAVCKVEMNQMCVSGYEIDLSVICWSHGDDDAGWSA